MSLSVAPSPSWLWACEFVGPSDSAFSLDYVIPKARGEQILIRTVSGGGTARAPAWLLIIPRDYATTRDAIRRLITQTFGEDTFSERRFPDGRGATRSATEVDEFKEQAPVYPFSDIVSKPYNRLEDLQAASTLHVRAIDTSELFGVDSSAVFLYRVDDAPGWGFDPHRMAPLPLPMRKSLRLVTSSEATFAQRLEQALGVSAKKICPPLTHTYLRARSYASLVEEARAWLLQGKSKD